jgi:BirA family biotin operon repressor/biotin-[acetyl-CoA-carboxylase] ligase
VIWRLPDYAKAGLLPLALGLGLVRKLQVYSPQVKLKWPNDLWAGERKLGGILCESTKHQGEIWVVAGVGLNINRPMQAPDIPAVSLAECCGVPLTRFEVLTLALAGANAALARLLADDVEWSEEFERFGNFLHRSVYLLAQGKAWRAIPRQVLPDGRLLVEAEDGSLRAVLAEEVSLRPVGHYQSGEYREGDKNRGDKTN